MLMIEVENEGGELASLRLFNPHKDNKGKAQLASFSEAVGGTSFDYKEMGRIVNAIADNVRVGHPLVYVWKPRIMYTKKFEEYEAIELVRFEKFDGVLKGKDEQRNNTTN